MKQHTQSFKESQASLGKQEHIDVYSDNFSISQEEVNSFRYGFEGNILKSIMTYIELETTVQIPLNVQLNVRYGIKTTGDFEYLNFENYIVYSVERQEEKGNYKVLAYDGILKSMKEYEPVNVAYPCSLKQYVQALADTLDYSYSYEPFTNDAQIMEYDYFANVGYTYRDVLDDIAEATASNIITKPLEERYKLEIVNFNETNEILDEVFIKTTNADFKTYGPINSIVLSRSISDNIYAKDQQSVEENGLYEIKISDNMLMNNVDRDRFITGIYNKLHGMVFTLYDIETIGVGYLEPMDKFSVQIEDKTYNLICFNNNYYSANGISETMHMDEPKHSQTDYKKADTTDQKINQTNLIVDKQQQTITGIITNVEDNTEKVSQLTQTVDGFSADIQQANTNANEARQQTAQLSLDVAELRSEISDTLDLTVVEEGYSVLNFTDINQSEPVNVTIHSNGIDITYLYPRNDLYPSNDLYGLTRELVFENLTNGEKTIYDLPGDLLWYSNTIYDEFYMDYETEICQITKRVGVDANGNKYPLVTEQIITYPHPHLELDSGDYKVYMRSYNNVYMKVRLMAQNLYTSQFATKVEMKSAITQSADEIETYVGNTYYTKEEGHTLESRVTQTESEITSEVVDRRQADTELSSLITQNANSITAEVANRTNAVNGINAQLQLKVDKDDNNQVVSMINASANRITLNSNRLVVNSDNFKVSANGTIEAKNGKFTGEIESSNAKINGGYVKVESNTSQEGMVVVTKKNDANQNSTMAYDLISINDANNWNFLQLSYEEIRGQGPGGTIFWDGYTGNLRVSGTINGGSDQRWKQDIKDSSIDAIEVIKRIPHREFRWKNNNSKVNVGYIAQEIEKIDKDLISNDDKGFYYINMMNMLALSTKAIQEQQQQIEQLQKEIKELKGDK